MSYPLMSGQYDIFQGKQTFPELLKFKVKKIFYFENIIYFISKNKKYVIERKACLLCLSYVVFFTYTKTQ